MSIFDYLQLLTSVWTVASDFQWGVSPADFQWGLPWGR